MIDYRILNKLKPITDEEKEMIKTDNKINRRLYMAESDSLINSRLLLEKGNLITVRPHLRFVDFPEHSHDYIEVVYMCTGTTTHIINGKKIDLCEGELLLLSRHAKHSILYAKEGDIAVNFIILPEFFETMTSVLGREESPLKSFVTDSLCENGGPDFLLFQVSDVLPVQNLIENLIWTLLNDTKNRRSVMRSTMELLFVQLLNYTDVLEYTEPKDEIILFLLRYIDDNYKNGSLSEAASILHCDFCWLSKEVKKKTGKTYTELLQAKRLSQSAYYLKNTKRTIADIASEVGYDNMSHFYRIFTEEYGVTPKKYREDSWENKVIY